jgi:hypothetical protein
MKIQVQLKNVYGRETIYPVCVSAKIFASIAGQKTLTEREIQKIKDLGYTVEVVSHKAVL